MLHGHGTCHKMGLSLLSSHRSLLPLCPPLERQQKKKSHLHGMLGHAKFRNSP